MLSYLLASAVAITLLVALVAHGRELRRLSAASEAGETGPESASPARAHRYGAIYTERADPLEGVRSVPGGPAMAVAAALVALQLLAGLLASGGRDRAQAEQAEQLAAVTARLDSMGTTVALLRDSLAALQSASSLARAAPAPGRAPAPRAVTGAAPTRAATAPRPQRAPAVVAPPPAVLPAPSLPPAPTTSSTPAKPDSALARVASPR